VPYEGQVLVDLRLDRNIYFLKQRAVRKMIGADSNRQNMSARLMVARELGDYDVSLVTLKITSTQYNCSQRSISVWHSVPAAGSAKTARC
jgi:hypothetical protein